MAGILILPPLDKTALRNATRILRTSLVSSPSAELVISARTLRATSLSFACAARVKAVTSSFVIAARIVAGILILPPLASFIDSLAASFGRLLDHVVPIIQAAFAGVAQVLEAASKIIVPIINAIKDVILGVLDFIIKGFQEFRGFIQDLASIGAANIAAIGLSLFSPNDSFCLISYLTPALSIIVDTIL